MNIDNGNLQFNRYQTGTIGNARPENVAANNTQTASGNAALAQAQEAYLPSQACPEPLLYPVPEQVYW